MKFIKLLSDTRFSQIHNYQGRASVISRLDDTSKNCIGTCNVSIMQVFFIPLLSREHLQQFL